MIVVDITLARLDLNSSKIPTSLSISPDKGFGGTSSQQQRGIKAIYSWDSYSKLNGRPTLFFRKIFEKHLSMAKDKALQYFPSLDILLTLFNLLKGKSVLLM